MSDLKGRRIAFLATNGYEPSELYSPSDTVVQNGAEAVLVSLQSHPIIRSKSMSDLKGRRIAFLATNGYEPSELYSPWDTVVQNGAEAVLVSSESGQISGGDHSQEVDIDLTEANAKDFDALV